MPDQKQPAAPKEPNPPNKKKKIIIGVLVAAGLLIAGWLLYDNKVQKGELYAESAGHKIYKQDVEDLIGDSEDISDHDAAKVLADKYLSEMLAEDQGISISDQEITEEYGPSIEKQKSNEKYAYQNKVNELYFNKLADYYRGSYKGKLLVAHFSRNIAFKDPLLKERKMLNKNLGNPAAIARDKKYAREFITKLQNQITSGKITFEQAIKKEHKDPVVGTKAYRSLSHSGVFDTSKLLDTNGLVESLGAKDQVSSIEPGQTSEPFITRIPGVSGSAGESYFLVVRMDEAAGGGNDMGFNQYLEQSKQELGYAIYV